MDEPRTQQEENIFAEFDRIRAFYGKSSEISYGRKYRDELYGIFTNALKRIRPTLKELYGQIDKADAVLLSEIIITLCGFFENEKDDKFFFNEDHYCFTSNTLGFFKNSFLDISCKYNLRYCYEAQNYEKIKDAYKDFMFDSKRINDNFKKIERFFTDVNDAFMAMAEVATNNE